MDSQTIISLISYDQLTQIINGAVRNQFQSLALSIKEPSVQSASPEYLTRRQTAELLGISLPTLNDWTKSGRIQGYRIGTRVRYKPAEIDAALKAIRTTQSNRSPKPK